MGFRECGLSGPSQSTVDREQLERFAEQPVVLLEPGECTP